MDRKVGWYILLSAAQASSGDPASAGTVLFMNVVASSSLDQSAPVATGAAVLEASGSVTSLLLVPPSTPSPSTAAIVVPVTIPNPTTVTDIATRTLTATMTEPPITVTEPAQPITVTSIVTITPMPPPATILTAWTAPVQMANLSAFNITYFPAGQQNVQIVSGIPTDPGSVTPSRVAEGVSDSDSMTSADPSPDDSAAVIQLFYPQDSINPGNPQSPLGGADFYATPLDLRDARNVSMEYSVFFPADFDWVQGGKLPGTYGGKVGCSGGDAAVTCFSTRLMWRAGGLGELYLYAPKDKQTKALCSTPPQSVCDAEYGLSIARGSFRFAAGNWTRVRQTVTLNTPGMQDGGFLLEVNGQPVINRSDVFYRDATASEATDGDDSDDEGEESDSGGLLGDLLGSPLRIAFFPGNRAFMARDDTGDVPQWSLSPNAVTEQAHTSDPTIPVELVPTLQPNTATLESTSMATSTSTTQLAPVIQLVMPIVTNIAVAYPTAVPETRKLFLEEIRETQPVGFTGLFFSTFFGGHEQQYASPRDQYAWFKDFSMTINA